MAFIVGEVVAPISADPTGFNSTMNQVKSQGEKAAVDIGRSFENLGKQMDKVGKTLLKTVTLPLAGIGIAAGKMGMDFESEMSKIVGLVGISQGQVGEWGTQLRDIGPDLAKGPKELAEALFFVTSAGLRGTEAMDALTISAKASAAGLGETKTIADTITSAMNAYGAENLSAAKATDILVAAVREGKLEASELAPVMGALLPTASSLRIGFDQIAGALAVMSRTGLGAAEAATSVNAIMTAMLKPSDGARKALEAAGLSMADLRDMAAKEPDGLIQAMRTLDKTFGDDEEALAQVIPNVRAFRGVMNVLAQDSSVVDSVLKGVTESTGSLNHAYETVSQTGEHKLKQVLFSLQDAGLTLWDTLKETAIPMFEKLGEKIRETTEWFKNLEPEQRENIVKWAGIAMAIGPLLIIGAKLITVIKGISVALTFLAANPVMLTIMAVTAALGGLAYMATTTSKKVRESTEAQIKAARDLEQEGLKALDNLQKSKVEAVEKERKAVLDLHNEKIKNINDEYNANVDIKRRETQEVIDELREQQKALDINHKEAIDKIRDEYGVFERTTKSKTDLVREHYDAEIAAANKAHNEMMSLLDKELQNRKSAVDRETSLVIGELEDQISLLEGASKEEVAVERQKRLERRAIELEDLIAAETDSKMKESLIQEREDIIGQIVAASVDKDLEVKKWGIREEILAEKTKAEDRKRTLNIQYEEEKTALETALINQTKLLEGKRDDELEIIQEEREAKEIAETAKYEATKTSLENQILAAEENLTEQKRILQEGLDDALEKEKARHDPIMADLDAEILKIQEWVDEMKKAMTLYREQTEEKAKEKGKGFESTILGQILEEAPAKKQIEEFSQTGLGEWMGNVWKQISDAIRNIVPQYANGTSFHPGGPAIVGERGAEILNLTRGDTITPIVSSNGGLGRMPGEKSIINIYVENADARKLANDIVAELGFIGVNI